MQHGGLKRLTSKGVPCWACLDLVIETEACCRVPVGLGDGREKCLEGHPTAVSIISSWGVAHVKGQLAIHAEDFHRTVDGIDVENSHCPWCGFHQVQQIDRKSVV